MDWATHADPKTGQIFYYNKKTKTATWEKPEELRKEDNDASNPNNLVNFWIETLDEKSNRIYYYNIKSKKLTWSRPQCLGKIETSVIVVSKEERALWEEAFDQKTNKPYWYHKITKEASWRNPTGNKKNFLPKGIPEISPIKPEDGGYIIIDNLFTDEPDDDKEEEKMEEETKNDNAPDGTLSGDRTHNIMRKKQSIFQNHLNDVILEIEENQRNSSVVAPLETKDFTKHRSGFINRVFRTGSIKDVETLKSFKKSAIKKALLRENRSKDGDAVDIFNHIMCYMGNKKTKKEPITHVRNMFQTILMSITSMIDEAYIQLLKQTTNNPSEESTIKGWELMMLCTSMFKPSIKMDSCMHEYYAETINSNVNSKIIQMAERCQQWLKQISHKEKRKYMPSSIEVEHVTQLKTVPITIKLIDGSSLPFNVDPFTTVKQVEDILQRHFKFSIPNMFALYEVAKQNEERILGGNIKILEVVALWEIKKEINVEKKLDEPLYTNFLYKAKLVLSTEMPIVKADPRLVNFLYHQALHDIVTSRYPCVEKDLAGLAALELQITDGDWKDEYKTGYLQSQSRIRELLPIKVLSKKGEVQDKLINEWEEKILTKYKALANREFEPLDMQLNYLNQVQSLSFYGVRFWLVDQNQFKHNPTTLFLGVNGVGVVLMHPKTKLLLERYQFGEIITWGFSNSKFLIIVGTLAQQRKLIFKTPEGKIINDLIQDYIRFRQDLRKQNAKK